ncbi:g4889 [Coccomyxa elongata]
MSEGAAPEPAASIAAAVDSEATASEGSHREGGANTGSPFSTATGKAEHARGQKIKHKTVPDLARSAKTALTANHPTSTTAAAHVSTAPGVATPSLSAPLPGAALFTPPPTVPAQRAAGENALQHVLSGHSAATFLESVGSMRLQGSSESVGLAGRNSILSSLDSLLAARQASAPPLGQPRPAAGAPEQLLASLLSALRRRQQQQSHHVAEGGPGPPAAAPQSAQLPGGGQVGSIARQLSNTSSLQALLSSVGIRLRTHKKTVDESQEPTHSAHQTSTPKGQERVAESQETPVDQGSIRRLQRTNSMPIPDPELRRILTGDLSALPPAHSQPLESAAVAFQLGQPLPNPFASYANDVLLQRQASSLASHQPPLRSAAAQAPAPTPPQAKAANSGTASRQSGDGQGRKRKTDAVTQDAPAEQSAESLPQPNIAHVRRALADALDFTASSKPGLARHRSALQPAVSVPVTGALASDVKRHVRDIQTQVRESMQSGMRSTQSLPPRSSFTANTYMALKRSLDAVARQGSGRVTAEEVQRLLGQAQQQIAQPGAWGSDGAAEDSEAARDGDQPGDTLDERIKRRRISNRDSARRTRQRRNREMAALREKNEELQAGAEALRVQVADLVDANQALQASVPSDQTLQELAAENAALKAELLELRAAVTHHLAAHASSLPYAQSIALSQVIEQACQQANADQEEGHQ